MKVIDKLDWNLLEDQKNNIIEILTKGITGLERKDSEHPLWGLVEFLADLIDEHDIGKGVKNRHKAKCGCERCRLRPQGNPSQKAVLAGAKILLERKGFFVLKNHDELFEAAKRECNMVSRDDVRQIASEELGMVNDPNEER